MFGCLTFQLTFFSHVRTIIKSLSCDNWQELSSLFYVSVQITGDVKFSGIFVSQWFVFVYHKENTSRFNLIFCVEISSVLAVCIYFQ